VAEDLDELTLPYLAATSGLEMLREGIRAIVRIEVRIHDIALVLSAAALSDQGARAALNDRLEVKRGAVRRALERVQGDGHFRSDWQLEEAVDVLAALLSIDTYERTVVEQGWRPDQLVSRICQLSQAFLHETLPA
jgi:hypothetical protein